jgi:hypothetical protein
MSSRGQRWRRKRDFSLPVFGEGGVGLRIRRAEKLGEGERKSPTLPSPKTGRERGGCDHRPRKKHDPEKSCDFSGSCFDISPSRPRIPIAPDCTPLAPAFAPAPTISRRGRNTRPSPHRTRGPSPPTLAISRQRCANSQIVRCAVRLRAPLLREPRPVIVEASSLRFTQ